jgi:hypothetical protein
MRMSSTAAAPIRAPFPEASELHLRISVGACRLRVTRGTGAEWVSGAYYDPTGALPCRILQEGGALRITQGTNVGGLTGLVSGAPRFHLELGVDRPYALTLEAGAAETDLDLGGLPLTRLTVKLGAASSEIDFAAPTPHPMALFTLSAGAGSVKARRLANANCAEFALEGGAAALEFDFGGQLQRDARAKITTGIASVAIAIPSATAARVATESVLGGLDIGDGLTKREGAFWTAAGLSGARPMLTVQASVTLGSIELRTN